MKIYNSTIQVRNVDNDVKFKAMYVAQMKGTTLSELIRQYVDEVSQEFSKYAKEE